MSSSTQCIIFTVIEWQPLIESLFGTRMLSTNENFNGMVIDL